MIAPIFVTPSRPFSFSTLFFISFLFGLVSDFPAGQLRSVGEVACSYLFGIGDCDETA
jgi:hypothetical protein